MMAWFSENTEEKGENFLFLMNCTFPSALFFSGRRERDQETDRCFTLTFSRVKKVALEIPKQVLLIFSK